MIVKIDKSLEKDLRKINDKSIKSKLADIIINIRRATKLKEIQNIKKLKGTKNFYRIRISDYRLGIIIDGSKVNLIRLLHRKEIYTYFP